MRMTILRAMPIVAGAVALALLVTGCGGSSSDRAKTNAIQSTPTQTVPTTTTTTPTTSAPAGGGATTDTTPTTPPNNTSTGNGGTPSNGGTGGNGSGGVYPGQSPANPSQSPGERYRQYCAAHPSTCGD
ncbi:MAG TPA: hypothetical protein VGN78_03455 [Solirubrobacteraceae bacterium]|nr:hypothetical protein [Solirubrobacteraceae bacterium]